MGVYSRGPACPVRNCTGDPDGGPHPTVFFLGAMTASISSSAPAHWGHSRSCHFSGKWDLIED
jgi:hypothetical protein